MVFVVLVAGQSLGEPPRDPAGVPIPTAPSPPTNEEPRVLREAPAPGPADGERLPPHFPLPEDDAECEMRGGQVVVPPNTSPAPRLPEWLPHYKIEARLDTKCRTVSARQVVRWTNRASKPTDHMIFHVYPRHRPDQAQRVLFERTIESFRLDPRTAIDWEGRRITVETVKSGEANLVFSFDPEVDTLMRVEMPRPVEPGQTVEIELVYQLTIPEVQGRWGQYRGITNLWNWYPLVAYHDDAGWKAPPFVGWHQPWLNEAGNYELALTVPTGESVASGAALVAEEPAEGGWKKLTFRASGLRDLALCASRMFELHEAEAAGIKIKVLALPEHRLAARQILGYASDAIADYSRWFGAFPHPEFTIAESYFGWNGNETGGMVLIDFRVFDAPQIGKLYIEHLISHEVCHQWWYGTVGTDGFSETWVDEGLVTHINQLRMQAKYGREALLLEYPRCLSWMPNVPYHTLVRSGYYLYRYRGGRGNVLAPLTEIGHVHNLFFLAYDRGSKVFSMIQQRIGDERFFAFLQRIYSKYGYRVLFFEDFKRELEAFTNEPWGPFLDDWLLTPKIADWKVSKAKVRSTPEGYETTVRITQRAQIDEPVDVGFFFRKSDGRKRELIPLEPKLAAYDVGSASVRKVGDHAWEVVYRSAERPRQVIVDPDDRILDANLRNNRWKIEPEIALTPIYTPLDEVPISRPLDQPSWRMGPNIDFEGRLGFRGSLIEPYQYIIAPFFAYSQWIGTNQVGVESEFFNVPLPNLSVGARYEYTLDSAIPELPDNQGKFFLRYTPIYTSSYIYPNLAYGEVYFRFGNNFYPLLNFNQPLRPGVEPFNDIRAIGLAYHLDTRMPYWNPEQGINVDAYVEHGFVAFGDGETYNRGWTQLAAVRKLPDGLGYLSETRLAGRVLGGIGSPDNGEHFRFGGPIYFRGQRTPTTQGSALWISSVDWRFPVCPRMNVPLADNVVNWQSLYASLFYDVGESFLLDKSQGVDHAVGGGLYFRLNLMSFLEQLTLRLEIAHSIRRDSTIAWFGLYQSY